jgi:hypothetical protein
MPVPERTAQTASEGVDARVRLVVVADDVVLDPVVDVLVHVEEREGEREDPAGVAGGQVVIELDVRAVLDLEAAHVPAGDVVVDPHVVGLPM